MAFESADATTDCLIVGQGLAGTVLALELLDRGRRVVVIDDPARSESSASRVAAGIVNPVTGRRLARSWNVDAVLPVARDFYARWEKRHGHKVFHPRIVQRFLGTGRERTAWSRKKAHGELDPYVADISPDRPVPTWLCAKGEAVEILQAGFLDTRRFLDVCGAFLGKAGVLRKEPFRYEDLQRERGGIRWRGIAAAKVVFCEGYRARRNPYFDWLPFRPVKGEILTLETPAIPPDRVLNNGKWILPVGHGSVRVGATYDLSAIDGRPTEAGRGILLDAFASMVNLPCTVTEHVAGVRPIVSDTRPVVGLHPGYDGIGILNGLGSKGVMFAPYYARQLADCLERGKPPDAAADVRRNL